MNHATQFITSIPIRLISGRLRLVEEGDFLLRGGKSKKIVSKDVKVLSSYTLGDIGILRQVSLRRLEWTVSSSRTEIQISVPRQLVTVIGFTDSGEEHEFTIEIHPLVKVELSESVYKSQHSLRPAHILELDTSGHCIVVF